MINEFTHLTIPFLISNNDNQEIDLSQISEFNKRYADLQLLQTVRGQIVVKRENQENYLFKCRKFQHKDDPSIYFHKLEYVGTLDKTYDPQHYFQDFHYQAESDDFVLQTFKKQILKPDRVILKEVIPPQFVKPFSWHGSNFKFENLDKQVKKSRFHKKAVLSIKFEDPIPMQMADKEDNMINELFIQKPVWLKSSLLDILNKHDIKEAELQLRKSAYYYVDGPWARCFVSYNYDPKSSAKSGQYQTILIINQNNEEIKSEEMVRPQKNQSVLQLCEIEDMEIQKLIKQGIEKAEEQQTVLCRTYGWFERRTHKQIVRLVKRLYN